MTISARESATPLVVRNLGTVEYRQAWQIQRELADARAAGVAPDTLLLLEHPSVFTAGRRTAEQDRPVDGTEVVEVDRGGKITWHGPGQLVGYPIVKLASPIDVVAYVRRLEEALIVVCSGLGLTCGRVDGRSGVWLAAGPVHGTWRPERKIAAIGVRVQKGVAMHGFALNANPDLTAFSRIVPCGIADAGVTSLTAELGTEITVTEITAVVTTAVADALDGSLRVVEHTLGPPAGVAESPTSAAPAEFTTVKFGA